MEHQPQRSTTNRLPFQQLLEHNDLAIIENPLRRIPEEYLYEYIKSFYDEAGLDKVIDFDTFIRAARLARDEEAFVAEEEAEQTLTQIERTALEKEKTKTIWTESQILTSWQTGTALGVAISGVIPLLVFDNWRFQISSSFIPAFALLLLVFIGSESPRWLIKKQRYPEAFTVLSRLRENPLLAARDLIFIWAQLQVETTLFMRTNNDIEDLKHQIPRLDRQVYLRQINLRGYARRITQLFTIPRARRATVASFIVMSAQQMTGVNVFAFLASTLFATGPVGKPEKGSLWLYFGFGIANFL
ncbi:MAG: hypothetical protein Q9167_006004 [Letrouitia subvulpina]